jgi:uncharacterized membrane protein
MNQTNFFDTILQAFNPKTFPADLLVVYAWTVLAAVTIYLPVLNESIIRVIFALPMVLFFPGYALIAALFPQKSDLDGIERLALSFGLSIAVAPLIGLALNYTPFGIRLDPIVVSLSVFTVIMALIAQYRRSVVSEEEQFVVPFRQIFHSAGEEFFPEEGTRVDRVLSIILLCAIIGAVATTIYVIAVPKEGEKFTEFYILGAEGKAADYPTDIRIGSPESIIIGIGNHEYRNVTYWVDILLIDQLFDPVTNTSEILAMQELSRFPVTLQHNSTYQEMHTFTVNDTEFNQLKFLLYSDEPPSPGTDAAVRINQSYRDLHLWITVRPR